jgi:hypothetical protein
MRETNIIRSRSRRIPSSEDGKRDEVDIEALHAFLESRGQKRAQKIKSLRQKRDSILLVHEEQKTAIKSTNKAVPGEMDLDEDKPAQERGEKLPFTTETSHNEEADIDHISSKFRDQNMADSSALSGGHHHGRYVAIAATHWTSSAALGGIDVDDQMDSDDGLQH